VIKTFLSRIKLFIWLIYKRFELARYYSYRTSSGVEFDRCCVLKIDGRVNHGGLADRLKSAVVVYAICKAKKMPFKLDFSSPFQLKDILIPNTYNWATTEKELTTSLWDTDLVTCYLGNMSLKVEGKAQIHVYNFGGGYIDDVNSRFNTRYSFASIFQELFKPNLILAELIDKIKMDVGQKYIAVTFRFQSLLGDFYEGEYFKNKGLKYSSDYKQKLLVRCLNALENIKMRHLNMPILVTSDSSTFLNLVSQVKCVKVVPGKTVHMDYTKNENPEIYLKAFLDLYILSGAEKIYRVSGMGLYETGFPKVAALMSNIEIEFVYLDEN
jgi:hypothetical protein